MSWPEQHPSNQPSFFPALKAHSDAALQAPFDVSQRTDSFDILVCGPVYIDYLLLLDGAPRTWRPGQIVREIRRAGGFGWNCAAALAHWGARVALIGNVIGTDSNGRAITRELAALPNLSLLSPIEDIETPYVVVSRAQSSGFQQRLERGEMGVERTPLPKARYAVFGVERNNSFNDAKIVGHLKRNRTPYLVRGLAIKTDWPLEASVLNMALPTNWLRRNLLSARLSVVKRRFDTPLICGDGLGGACLVSGTKPRFACAQESGARDVLNEESAADIFVAGIAWARWQGWSFERAMGFAGAAAMLKSRASGADWPRLEDVEALAK